jgi:hypothetical protein
MKKLYLFITLLTTGYFFGQSNYLVENFNYTAAGLLTDNGWTAHSGGTTNAVAVNPTGLSWATYIGSGVGNAALVNNTGQDVNKPLDGFITQGSVYASFLFKPSGAITSTSTSNYFFHFLKYTNEAAPVFTSINSAFRARTFVLQGTDPLTQFKLGLNFNAADFISPSNVTGDLDINATYLVVVKYTFVDGAANDTASLYVFAEGQSIAAEPAVPTVGPVVGTGDPVAPDLNVIQGIALRQNSAGQNCIVDGIYVRTVWDLTNAGNPLSVDSFATNNTVKVYPNPVVNQMVTISSSLAGEKEVTLFDLNGRMLLQKTMTSDELELTSVSKGIYLLQTKIGTFTTTNKLVIN